MDSLLQDFHFGLRMLHKSPGFTAVAILILALGIGANTAIFTVTYGVLLKPLPYPDSSRLVQLWQTTANPARQKTVYLRTGDFREVKTQSHIFDQLAEYAEGTSTILGGEGAESVQTSFVSGNFFPLLGVRPLLGRLILPSNAELGRNQVAVLSFDLWQRRYGGDPGIVGKQITLTDEGEAGSEEDNSQQALSYEVVGVMPSRFPFPNHGDLLLPQTPWKKQSRLIAIGRLKSGISMDAANAELHTIAARIAAEAPAIHKNFDLSVGLLRDRMSEGYSTKLLVLFGAAGFLLLLASADMSSLLIARSWARQREVAIRETLGATRWRLIRQFLSESVLLAFLGAAAGLFFAYWGIDLLRIMAPPSIPRLDEIAVDWVVLAYTLVISLFIAILFGLAPALQITRRWPSEVLKGGSSGHFIGIHPHRPRRMRNFLVAGEISLAFVLVIGSALALRSFSNLLNVNLGFRPAHVLTMYVGFSPAIRANPERYQLAVNQTLQRTRAIPGVKNSAFAEWLPIGGGPTMASLTVEGSSYSGLVECQFVTPGYFSTLGIPLLAGRSFNEGDTRNFPPAPARRTVDLTSSKPSTHSEKRSSSSADSQDTNQEKIPLAAIVNATFAKRLFDGNALGKQFRADCSGSNDQVRIIGEVGDVRDESQRVPPIPEVYIPVAQTESYAATTLFVRTVTNPLAIAKTVREQISAVDPNAPIDGLRAMDAVMSESVAEPKFETTLLGAFGGVGLLLAIVGVYGLISYSVIQRTHEFSVRIALGALPQNILRMVVREGMFLAIVGVGLGVTGALALTRFLSKLLFGIKPTDLATFAGVAIVLTLVALAACYIPARRAMRVEPIEALRYE
ncbi:MAG TPA: ABC transporter permease [Candidatus Acidoferrales bacterium]|nr:ABC transporter permease [Candidatus Acidoferrales bacterium]